jgi:hypothetical protein
LCGFPLQRLPDGMRSIFAVLLSIHAIAVVGCHHAPSAVGSSAFHFVETQTSRPAAPAAVYTLPDDTPQTFVEPAKPIEPLAKPAYPSRALGSNAGPIFVGVQLAVDSLGNVTNVQQSWKTFTSPSRYEADFRAAVEAAVRQWRFYPAQLQVIQRVQRVGRPDRYVVRHSDPTEWTFEVVFTFNDSGSVVANLAAR